MFKTFALFALLSLCACSQKTLVKNPSPPMNCDGGSATTADANTDMEGCVDRWRSMVVKPATEWKASPEETRNPNVAPLYAGTAASINEFIEAYAAELGKPDPRFGNLKESGENAEAAVKKFVEVAAQGNQQAAIEWAPLLPLIKDVASLVFDKYREIAKENTAAAESMRANDVTRLQARKLPTDINML